MTFGLLDTGFNKKTLTDVKEEIDANVAAVFDAPNVDPDSVFGQYNGIIAEVASDLWDLADLVYGSQYALSANGTSLDAVAELNNLTRLNATSSSVTVILEGTNLTTIPPGTEFRQDTADQVFQTIQDVQLDQAVLLKVLFSVNDFATSPHTIDISTVAGTDNFSSSVVSSELDVLNDFQTQINTTGNHNAVVDVDNLTLTITNILVSDLTTFGVVFDATMTIDEQWTPVVVEAINTGPLPIPVNSIQSIETPVVGLNSVDNLIVGTQGRDLETDDDFRIRRKQSIRVVGAATVPAIEARLVEDVEAVVSATVKDNRTDIVDANGRPPHSYEAIITFSPDTAEVRQEIADKIFEVGAAGIETFGGITEQVTDSSGDLVTINFSQPTDKFLHIKTNITLNPEEVFPANGIDAIKQALADFGNDLKAGDDAIRQRFFNSIYSVSGVKNIELFNFAVTKLSGDTPSFFAFEGITNEPSAGLYDLSAATLITSGVVTGMVVRDVLDDEIITTVKQLLSETQFRGAIDAFNVSDTVEFGGFGEINIAINENEIARFDVSRISVTIV